MHSWKRRGDNQIMPTNREGILSFAQAEARVQKAAEEVEEAINTFNGTFGEINEVRRADLASVFISLLAEKYTITPPFNTIEVSDDE
jgi:hypothetical protein